MLQAFLTVMVWHTTICLEQHQALSNRLTIERCLVTFMMQLIQEGFEVPESVRLQVCVNLH